MKRTALKTLIIVVGLISVIAVKAQSQTPTAFTYQGRLTDAGSPANGQYDFEFKLYNASAAQLGSEVTCNDVQVVNGVFLVQLDFGVSPFIPGAVASTLEIGVRPATSTGAFTTLSPRQPITSSPYSVQTINAEKLGGVDASEYVKTDDPRLTDGGPPAPGSNNYIQNSNTQQPNVSFNIGGNGLIGSKLGIGTTDLSLGYRLRVAGDDLSGVYSFTNAGNGVWGGSSSGIGVAGDSDTGDGVNGFSSSGKGVHGGSASGVGINGTSTSGNGVRGSSSEGNGVTGTSVNGFGVVAISDNKRGVYAAGKIAVFHEGTSWFRGDTTPLNTLTSGTGIAIGSVDSLQYGYIFSHDYSSGPKVLALNHGGGRVGIGTTAPDQTLSVNGGASKPGGGSWATFSDERLKNVRGPFTTGLSAIMQLQPIRYEYKPQNALGLKATGEYVGFGAQAVEKIIPEAVNRNDQGYGLVNNDPILWAMLNAIKEQQAQLEQQRKEIEALKRVTQRKNRE
jgi:hypothetical protein